MMKKYRLPPASPPPKPPAKETPAKETPPPPFEPVQGPLPLAIGALLSRSGEKAWGIAEGLAPHLNDENQRQILSAEHYGRMISHPSGEDPLSRQLHTLKVISRATRMRTEPLERSLEQTYRLYTTISSAKNNQANPLSLLSSLGQGNEMAQKLQMLNLLRSFPSSGGAGSALSPSLLQGLAGAMGNNPALLQNLFKSFGAPNS
jgi:hypothetical protein